MIDPEDFKLPARLYADKFTNGGDWRTEKEFALYMHPGSRMAVAVQRHDNGAFGLQRSEELGKMGLFDADIDADALADDIVKSMCRSFSIYELRRIIPKMQETLDEWESRRQVHIDANKDKP